MPLSRTNLVSEGGLVGPAGACACTVAEAILPRMAAHGIEFIFLNPGTDTAPLQEALAARGAAVPKAVLCNHEKTAWPPPTATGPLPDVRGA